MLDFIDLPQLRRLIGIRLRHQGRACVAVEVLEDPPAIVLAEQGDAHILPDLHGRPQEYAQPTHTVPVFSADRSSLSEDWRDLERIG